MNIPSKLELERFSDEAAKLLSRREESGTPVAQRHIDRFEAVKSENERRDMAEAKAAARAGVVGCRW
jgi:hypothetical protein